ncbi:hypothetical protein KSC_071340 [Ktedonobacter sp. SOSP1-52]|nr:hypothetical protein KSC_071340 [Ktedonobacter sp. SOSP1-52]
MPLDLGRPYFAQIARFDPSKGIPDALESYRQVREMLQGHCQLGEGSTGKAEQYGRMF